MDGTTGFLFYQKAAGIRPAVTGGQPVLPGFRPVSLADIAPPEGWTVKHGKPPLTPLDIEYMAATVRRCAPWVSAAYLVPEIIDERGRYWGGVYSHSRATIFVCYGNWRFSGVLSTLHHEIFHAVQRKITDDDRAALYDAAWDRGFFYQDTDYLARCEEKTARLYQNFAMFLEEGGEIRGGDWITAWLGRVYTGAWADELAEIGRRNAATQARQAARRAMLARIAPLPALRGTVKNIFRLSG